MNGELVTDLLESAAAINGAIETVRSHRHARRAVHRVLDGSIGYLWDYQVVLDETVADGTVFIHKHRWTITIGTRPLSVVERAGYDARHMVRAGLADVLEWLGEDVGPALPVNHHQILNALRGAA